MTRDRGARLHTAGCPGGAPPARDWTDARAAYADGRPLDLGEHGELDPAGEIRWTNDEREDDRMTTETLSARAMFGAGWRLYDREPLMGSDDTLHTYVRGAEYLTVREHHPTGELSVWARGEIETEARVIALPTPEEVRPLDKR
jgi:hypothetical protein